MTGLLNKLTALDYVDLFIFSSRNISLNKEVKRIPSYYKVFSVRGLFELSLNAQRKDVDIIHCPMYVTPFYPRARLVVTIHDLIPIRMPEVMSRRGRRSTYYILNKHAINTSEVILVPSESTKSDVLDIFDCSEEKVHVIHHALDDVFLNVAENRADYIPNGLRPGDRYLLSVGSAKPNKNLVRLLEAFARVKKEISAKLVLIGDLDARYPEVQFASNNLHIQNDVIFTGRVTDSELLSLYSKALAFVFPSVYEGFGLPPLEAMACNTPVTCSKATSLPEVVGDAALLFDPYSVESISNAIVRVVLDQQLRVSLIAKGRQRINEFTWDKTLSRVLKVYEDLIKL